MHMDRVDALYIYGGLEIEQLVDTLPDSTSEDIRVLDYEKGSTESKLCEPNSAG